jgi:hypothetical protein
VGGGLARPGAGQRWLAALRWPPGQNDDLVLAVNEAVSNSVEHGRALHRDDEGEHDGHDDQPPRPGPFPARLTRRMRCGTARETRSISSRASRSTFVYVQ